MATPPNRAKPAAPSIPTKAQAPPTHRSPDLAKFILLTSLGVGVLAGLAEICWSYLLPVFSAEWRAVLPTSASSLLAFAAAALATDVPLVLAGGILLLIPLSLLTRATRLAGTSRRLRVLARGTILGGVLCYLYIGWMVLFVLLASQRQTLAYWLILIGGAATLLLLALLASAAITAARRRWHRATPTAIWSAAVIVLVILIVPLFWHYRASQVAHPIIAVSTAGPRPNILLVTVDTLRVDYLGCYGHPWIKTPTVDALAGDGVVFDAAISQAPSTTPSHCSLMTSMYPFDHGAENGKPMKRGLITLADVLGAHGYETVAFTSATTTRSINSGLQQGFDRYVDSLVAWSEAFGHDEFQHLILFYLVGIAEHSRIPGEVVTNRALRWLEDRSGKPFFAWLHYFDPHLPYGSPPPFRQMYKGKIADGRPMATQRERYAEDITYVDFQLDRFIDALQQKNLYDNTLIIVASDHGEAFGERHGDVVETSHGRYLYDTTQHVPLVFKPPGARRLARRVAELIELTDVAPTVLNLLQIDVPAAFVGKPLAELLEDRPFSHAGRDAHAFNVIDVVPPGAARHEVLFVQQLAVRSKQWKFITRPRLNQEELYDLLEDPREFTNLASERLEDARQHRTEITSLWDRQRDTSQDPRQRLAPALVRELQALGYLGGDDQDDG